MIDFLGKKLINIANLPFYNVTVTIKENDIILEKRVFTMMVMSDLISWLEAAKENKNIEVSYEDYHGFSKFINAYFEANQIVDKENEEDNKINQEVNFFDIKQNIANAKMLNSNNKDNFIVLVKECRFA